MENCAYLRKNPGYAPAFYKKWQTLAVIREISDSNLETGRNGSKSGVSRIIRESKLTALQPCSDFLRAVITCTFLMKKGTCEKHLNGRQRKNDSVDKECLLHALTSSQDISISTHLI